MSNIEHKDVGVSSLNGTPSKKIYIKTSTEAVYNPEGVTQEYINNHVDGSKIVDGTITTSKIANNAVAMGKLGNEVQTLIQQGADSSWTPMGDYDVDALYYANDLVFDPETNSSYLSLRADNMGHAVTDETWWMKVLDGSYVNLLEEELQQLVDSISEGTQQQVEELNEALEALEAQADQSRQDIQDIVNSLAVVQTTGDSTTDVMSQKAVTDELAQINDLRNIGLLNVYFDGIGTTYATSDKFYVVAGHILKFTLVEQNVPYDSITSAQSRFMIYSRDANDVETTLYRVNGTNLPDKEIVVCVPNDSVCLYIGGRCSRGYRYECEVVDISYDYKDTSITINDLYYHLTGNPEYKSRINILLPYQNNAVVKIRPKISTPTYQYEIDGAVINNNKTTTFTILIGYSNTQIDYIFKGGYSYIIVFFKKGNNLEVDKSELLSEYDINVEYPETIEELKITDGDKKWDLIGLSKISNNEAKTDFIVLPNLPMRVKMDIPIWMKVSFTTGNRTNRVYLGTYYSGDIVDFSQGSAGVFVDFKRLDNRGFDADFYTRHSKFLGMSLTQIGSNDGNIFERNFDNEKNLGGIMATGPQSIQRFPTIVHVSDAHGDSFRLNAAHDYADYINADLVVNTGDNAFYTLSDGVNFVKDIVFSHKADFANCIGNHDQYTSTLADVFSLNISPFATEYGYHKSTASDITDKCYYFKDLSAQKIRLIVLDVYDGLAYQAYKARISQEQINWFVSTLSATPQDYGVIVVSHQAPHTINAISGKANFNDVTMEPQINALDSDYMKNGKITGNPLGKIIDAFIVKGSVSGSYTQKKATSSANETISYSADFSNVASGVEFIAYINGHTHRDFIGYVADCENNQLNCNVCSTSPLSQTTGYGDKSDIYRDANGVAQDAFNVYTIDRYNHRLGVCRIGSNLSLNLIDRKVLWFSYV